MSNYLLLRNNRESGPYSLDGLIELGLKPYDLIWVQGKSAAWRYSSEVEELKPIAPAVEEQPFDRFFKKTEEKKEPIATRLPVEAKEPQKVVVEESQKPEIAVIKPEYEKYIPKKSVYVTMPGQKNTAAKESIKETVPVKETLPVKETIAAAIPAQPTITISENPVASQIKYSQPLDEIKEMYVKTLQNRKQKIARKSFWIQNLRKTAALLSLVAVGLIAGFVIKSNGGKQKEIVQQQNLSLPQTAKSEPVTAVPEVNKTDTVIAATEDVQTLRQPTGGFVNKNPALQDNTGESGQLTDKPVDKSKNEKKETVTIPRDNTPVNSFPAEGVEIDQATGERSRKVRNSTNEPNNNNSGAVMEKNSERKSFLSDRIARLVSVKSNEYKRVAFGGIRDLQLTVTNDSKYVLDNVTVELQYIKPNELPLKTENIQFTSVGPNATSTIRVPDTNRGIKVFFRIVNVKSRQMDEVAGNQ